MRLNSMLRAALGVLLILLSTSSYAKLIYLNSTVQVTEENVGFNSFIPAGTVLTLNAEVNVGDSTPQDFLHVPNEPPKAQWTSRGTISWVDPVRGPISYSLDSASTVLLRYNGSEEPVSQIQFSFLSNTRFGDSYIPYNIYFFNVAVDVDFNVLDEPNWSTPYSELVDGLLIAEWSIYGNQNTSATGSSGNNSLPTTHRLTTNVTSDAIVVGPESLNVSSEVVRIEDIGKDGTFDQIHAPVEVPLGEYSSEEDGISIGAVGNNSESVGLLRFDTTGLNLANLDSAYIHFLNTRRAGAALGDEVLNYRIVAFADGSQISIDDATEVGTVIAEVEVSANAPDYSKVQLDTSALAGITGNILKMRLELVSGDGINFTFRSGGEPLLVLKERSVSEDIIINNGDSRTSSTGSWNASRLAESYEGNSLWANAGGAVDSYRFTPVLQGGEYEVFAWNSCYRNRATNVPHRIVHANGETTVEVDQDCDTGTHGEWYSLGVYSFDQGSNGFLEISDAGLVPPSTTYLGADAARFVSQTPFVNNPPYLRVNFADSWVDDSLETAVSQITVGGSVSASASAIDVEDGDVSSSVRWSMHEVGAEAPWTLGPLVASSQGSTFSAVPPAVGTYVIFAEARDSHDAQDLILGRTLIVNVNEPDGTSDTDNDGLTYDEEEEAGTDPNNPDSDGDGLSDGDEVNTYLSDPLLLDSDGDSLPDGDEVNIHHSFPFLVDSDHDGLPDNFEVISGLEVMNPTDATLDLDRDGVSNLEEFLGGTDVGVADSGRYYPQMARSAVISGVDGEYDAIQETPILFTIQNTPGYASEVSIAQMALPEFSGNQITSATLTFQHSGHFEYPGIIGIYLYADDGAIELDDATVSGVLVGSYDTNTTPEGEVSVMLDPDVLTNFVGSNIGFRFQAAGPYASARITGGSGYSELVELEIFLEEVIEIDIIIDNGDAGTIATSGWSAAPLPGRYGETALWAVAGGNVESYQFTPTIEQSGEYEVFAWNSCFNNRAINVPHMIRHAAGVTVVEVDQDCDTGSSGEWYSLGVYYFATGTSGGLEITDDGLTPSSTTYFGADAARFVYHDISNLDEDSDGLSNGDEQVLGTFPHIADSDGDGLPDGFEVDSGLNPLDDLDAALDFDHDGVSNLQEFLNGSNVVQPDSGYYYPQFTGSAVIYDEDGDDVFDSITTGPTRLSIRNYPSHNDISIIQTTLPEFGGSEVTSASITIRIAGYTSYSINMAIYLYLDDGSIGLADATAEGTLIGTFNPSASGLGEISVQLDPNIFNEYLGRHIGLRFENLGPYTFTDLGGLDSYWEPPHMELTYGEADVEIEADIIIDNGDAGTTASSGWSPSRLPARYGDNALWAVAGGSVESYDFTPTIQYAGNYEVFAWNSCYNNRATNVPHVITHADGITVVEVDQDCDTGSSGEWFSLGVYRFTEGTSGGLEITDEGLTPSSTTYIGADAARFVYQN